MDHVELIHMIAPFWSRYAQLNYRTGVLMDNAHKVKITVFQMTVDVNKAYLFDVVIMAYACITLQIASVHTNFIVTCHSSHQLHKQIFVRG